MLKITEGLIEAVEAREARLVSNRYDEEKNEAIGNLNYKARQLGADCARLLFGQMKSGNVVTEIARPKPISPDMQRAFAILSNDEIFKRLGPTRRATKLLGEKRDFIVEKLVTPINVPGEPDDPTPKLQVYRYRQNVANDHHQQTGRHSEPIPSFKSAVYVAEVSLNDGGVTARDRIAVKEYYSKNIAGEFFRPPMQVDDRIIHYTPELLWSKAWTSGFDDDPQAMGKLDARLNAYRELLASVAPAQSPTA